MRAGLRLLDFGSTPGPPSNVTWAFTDATSNPSIIGINGTNYSSATFTTGTQYHIALVLTPNGGNTAVAWYQFDTSGDLLASGNASPSWNLSQLTQTNMWLGRSEYGDPDANASYNEVRIWDAALTESQLYNLSVLGPDAVLTSAGTGNSQPIATPVQVAAGATFDLGGLSASAVSLADYSGSGGRVINSAAGTTSVLTLVPSGATTFSGAIAGGGTLGAVALTMNGPGTQVLAGSNTYTGPTTINQGKLSVNGSLASAVTVASGGTLGGTGSLSSVTVSAGGQLSPGDAPGILNISGSLTLVRGAVMDYELGTPTDSDEVLMPSGMLALNGQQFSDFNFTALGGFGDGDYTLIDAGSTSGSLGAITCGTIDGQTATLAVQGGNLVLTVVPEPSSGALLLATITGTIAWRRRGRAKRRPGGSTNCFP